ncbi:MAG TPA: hypothetical protein PK772_08640 [Chitinophagaceae bacterium]|nr:hypothetical protein [Chitinophagaceae bacterium]
MMSKIKHIVEGWSKKLHLTSISEEQKVLALQRMNICMRCRHAKEQWMTKIIDGILKNDELGSGIGCGLCGCPLQAKVLVKEEKCPIGKWQ